MTKCKFCHKKLTDAFSVKLGIGPVCRLNLKIAEITRRDLFTLPRACYDYEIVDRVVCIVDNDRGRSVTNDAAAVIGDLIADDINLTMCPVIYRDTMGVWDRLVVIGGQFAGFSPIGTTTRDEAIKKLSLVSA
jgi:hypothetical protein